MYHVTKTFILISVYIKDESEKIQGEIAKQKIL